MVHPPKSDQAEADALWLRRLAGVQGRGDKGFGAPGLGGSNLRNTGSASQGRISNAGPRSITDVEVAVKLGAFTFAVHACLPLLATLFYRQGALRLGSVSLCPFSFTRPKRAGVFGPTVGRNPY